MSVSHQTLGPGAFDKPEKRRMGTLVHEFVPDEAAWLAQVVKELKHRPKVSRQPNEFASSANQELGGGRNVKCVFNIPN